jgi:hypothetical protein
LLKKPGASAPWRDLSRYRRYGPGLEAEEERILIALAQSGHDRAGWELHQAFHGKIVQLAGKRVPRGQTFRKKLPGGKHSTVHSSELFEDLIAEGHLALEEAIKGYAVGSEHRLWSFASKGVTGAISDAAAAFRQHVSGATRIDRWLFGHWNATAEQLLEASKKLGLKRPLKSMTEAADCIELFRQRYYKQSFETTLEGGEAEDCAGKLLDARGFLIAEEVRALYDFFSPYQLAPHLRIHGRVSGIVDDLAAGRTVEPERYQKVAKYFDEEERQAWIHKQSPKTKPPLPLLRPRHWHTQSKKRRRKSYAARAQSVEGRS